jgi:HSP20 family protein
LPKKKRTEKKQKEKPSGLVPYRPLDIMRGFDRILDDFRRPSFWPSPSMMPTIETRIPYADLEDRGKDYMLTLEMPGFKKDDIDIQVTDNSVEVNGRTGYKYDKKTRKYICIERECESFYRRMELPEEIKTDKIVANLKEGILEIVLPKKTPKTEVKKKIIVK